MSTIRYAKLLDGALHVAPNPIRLGGEDVFTTDPRPYGYKPVRIPAPPEAEDMVAVPDGWDETETEIRQRWRLEPEEAEIEDYEAALGQLGVG